MSLSRTLRALALTVLLSPLASAADTPKWDAARTTSPESVEDLRALQESVKSVVEKVTPATVAILQPPGAGSGVIVSPDGLILTAAHVIEPPRSGGFRGMRFNNPVDSTDDGKIIRVILSDGNTMVKAKLLGRNPKVDSGMAKIIDPIPKNASWPGAKDGKWPFAPVGDSVGVQKRQWVVSLGHPGGPKPDRRPPVRLGQVVYAAKEKEKAIVSDCTLVGGDSGGPLFDLKGNVIGIHSRIGLTLDDNIHVPTKAFQDDWKRLYRGDVVGREPDVVLGIVLNREGKKEPVCDEVPADKPAGKAGLKAGDKLLKLNGEPIVTSDDVDQMLSAYRAGETVTLEAQRGEELLEAKVKLIAKPGGRNRKPDPDDDDQ